MSFKLVTFNMCHGEGLDGIIDVKRQADFFKEYNPDLMCLQEVQVYTDKVNNENQIQTFANTLNFEYMSMGSNIRYKNGYYGNGIITKYPIISSINYLMPLLDLNNEQRGILHTKINIDSKKLNILSLHLATNKNERFGAIKELIKVCNYIDEDEYIIIAGDFNLGIEKVGNHEYSYEKLENYPEIEILKEKFNYIDNKDDTWFSKLGNGCLDKIFYSKNIKLNNFKTLNNDVSDHSALYADFDLN